MRTAFNMIVFVCFICSCDNKKENETGSPFTYRSSMMNRTLINGTRYDVQRKDHYELNDVVVYSYTDLFYGKKLRVAGRIAGVPGDTIVFVNGQVLRNKRVFVMPNTALYHYTITLNKNDNTILSELNVVGNTSHIYDCFLTKTDSLQLVKKYKDFIVSIKKSPLEMNNEVLLNNQNRFNWNMDDFGPVIVPKVGSQINRDNANIFINKNAGDENAGGTKISEPLYFIVCDNFDDCTTDSRSVGLIADSQIEGYLKLSNK